jgi:uncharacterized membrane protein HdeD (DUF308 family)
MRRSALAPGLSPAVSGINRVWLLALGIFMIVLGVIGLGMSYVLTTIVLFWIGILAILAGAGQLLDAFHHKKWSGLVWHVIVGLVYILAGIVLAFMPTFSAFWLTLFIAISLMITGLMRILTVFRLRGHRGLQLLVLLSGLVSMGLGFFIYRLLTRPAAEVLATAEGQLAWTSSWQWVIGLFVAIELIMEGVALISIALTASRARDG